MSDLNFIYTPYDTCPCAVSVVKMCALATALTVISCASEVLGSKLGWGTDCSDRQLPHAFPQFLQVNAVIISRN